MEEETQRGWPINFNIARRIIEGAPDPALAFAIQFFFVPMFRQAHDTRFAPKGWSHLPVARIAQQCHKGRKTVFANIDWLISEYLLDRQTERWGQWRKHVYRWHSKTAQDAGRQAQEGGEEVWAVLEELAQSKEL